MVFWVILVVIIPASVTVLSSSSLSSTRLRLLKKHSLLLQHLWSSWILFVFLFFFFNLLCSLIHQKGNSCVKMVKPVYLRKSCHSFSQVYKNTPSAKDISYKLGYSSMLVKMFWNGWHFIFAYDIIEIIDWKEQSTWSTKLEKNFEISLSLSI